MLVSSVDNLIFLKTGNQFSRPHGAPPHRFVRAGVVTATESNQAKGYFVNDLCQEVGGGWIGGVIRCQYILVSFFTRGPQLRPPIFVLTKIVCSGRSEESISSANCASH